MSKTLFFVGVAMIAWDLLGHFTCLICRLNSQGGVWWNAHSRQIWPSISNSVAYDGFWSAWFALALGLIIAGYFLKGSSHA